MIEYLIKEALEAGNTDPIYHALTRPSLIEGEATGRAASLPRWQALSSMLFM